MTETVEVEITNDNHIVILTTKSGWFLNPQFKTVIYHRSVQQFQSAGDWRTVDWFELNGTKVEDPKLRERLHNAYLWKRYHDS